MFGFSVLSVTNLLVALLSYVRFAGITRFFGADWRTDAFAVSLVVPFLVRDLISHSFGSTFLPIYARVAEKRGREGAVRFVNLVVTWVVIAGVVLIAGLFAGSRQVVQLVSPGGSGGMLDLASVMLKLLLPMVLLRAVNGILSGFIQYQKRFSALGMAGVLDLLVSTVMLFAVGTRWGVMILPISITAGVSVAFVFILCRTVRCGYEPGVVIERDRHLGQLLQMAFPVTLGTLAGFLGPVADKVLASFLVDTSITALDYADRIKNIVFAVAFAPFAVMAEISYSTMAARGERESLKSGLLSGLNNSSLLMFPVAAFLTVLSFPVVSVLFQKGSFTSEDARYVGYALAFYAPWLLRSGLFTLTAKAFYAMRDSATPVIIGVIGLVVNVLLNFILIGPLGIGGLALATTLSSTMKAFYQAWALSRKLGGLGLRAVLPEQLKMLAATGVMIASMLLTRKLLPFQSGGTLAERAGLLALYSLPGFGLYFALLGIMGCGTLSGFISLVKEKWPRRESFSQEAR